MDREGLGIKHFLKDKNILITGATGFLAKVLVEKILRTQPDVGHLFLLINAKSSQSASERLRKEVQCSRLFQVLQDKHGDEYEDFIQAKLTAVAGNVAKEDVGIDKDVAQALASEIDVIVNSAATTNFIERYDTALDINTKGPFHLLEFAKRCHRLKLFLHVSTAYVNGKRVGRALEKPFRMDESIARESLGNESAPLLSVAQEIESVCKLSSLAPAHDKDEVAQQTAFMKELGLKRAALHGWQDTYVFTKAMGEMLVCENRQDVPVVIVRPTVVEGTFNQPFSGWMEGIRMMDPILLTYGKGQTSSFYVDPNGVLDVVPADMVVNTILASMAKHAGKKGCLNVYQVGSSVVNPLTFDKLAKYTYEHFRSQPFVDQKGNPVMIPKMTFITNKYTLFLYNYLQFNLPVLISRLFPWFQREDTQRRLKYLSYASQRVNQLIDTYAAYTFYKGRFDISNLERLYKELSAEERDEFGFAVWSIDWDKYIKDVHLPGLRKYTLDGNTAFRL
ncbi:fatty acyl-CoA reductase 2 [Selaginella moellendorffii]|uniref:fatty acyl-CoA reductase 2 n=1 Tax=Selaginella moellendorffii TaxID=88036 RepID=UPI000D1C816C|nr:fatty acyl-CoA reductase 2 [Selaginella moellendorffii]|eukprot:XP_024524209.1 fatty acyl-CoA reductase 2 [Selaginella moellendorffii]